MPEISPSIQKLISKYQEWQKSLEPQKKVSTIHVDEVASAVAVFYEKIREVVDWKEEHLLRRAAIERILKRRLIFQKRGDEIAEPLVLELIRAGHFPNDRIEETKIDEVKIALQKYQFFLDNIGNNGKKLKLRLYDWLMNIASCEIEEILAPPIREKALIDYMSEFMSERIELSQRKGFYKPISQDEKNTQIYIACQRALFKLDSPIISYYLLQKKYPIWNKLTLPLVKDFAENLYSIREEIERELKHPLSEKFYKICERQDTAFLILGDILSQNPSEAIKNLSNPEFLESSIRKFYQSRLTKVKKRVKRAAFFSTVSIFITKILVALAIEIPLDKYLLGNFNYTTIGLNVIIPPLLMFFLVLTIKPPRKENLNKVIIEVIKIVYKSDQKDIYSIRTPRKKGIIIQTIVATFYFLIFLISFGVIVWVLQKLNFGIISIGIFLMFLSLIIFAGVKIRERAKELNMEEEKEGFISFIVDSFSLPFLRLGKWLSRQWAKYNIVLMLINAFIDMPFQMFTEFLEHWRTFLKEKKEEIS
jgi:hypothetical protein